MAKLSFVDVHGFRNRISPPASARYCSPMMLHDLDNTAATTACPNCRESMTTLRLDTFAPLKPVDVEMCAACGLIWFDRHESISLAPKAVIGLLRFIGEATGTSRMPLASTFRCPRCAAALATTHDLQRTTRFTYWRCLNGHGRLITFTQFLREKNFIRPPSVDELRRLRETVRQIACSQCGAPIDLTKDTACKHCAAPVALIDSDGIAKALRELSVAPALPDPEKLRSALRDAQIDAIFDLQRMRERGSQDSDLVAIGAGAVAGLIGALIFGRS
jgi:hypothetical protein